MPTVCDDSGAANGYDSTLDLKKKLLSKDNSMPTQEKCRCHEFSSGRQFGRTISLDPGLLNRCAECQKERTKAKLHVHYDKISETDSTDGSSAGQVSFLGDPLGGTKVVENRMGGGTQLVLDPDSEAKQNLLNADKCEQSDNEIHDKKGQPLEECDPEKGSGGSPRRKPWTRRKLTVKIFLVLTVLALAIAGVVLGVMNKRLKGSDPPVHQSFYQPSTPLPVTDVHTHSHLPSRNCTLVMELNKPAMLLGSQSFQTYTIPWRSHSAITASDSILYSPETLTFNATKSGDFSVHVDVHIDTNFWISEEHLQKTFSSVLCIQFPMKPSYAAKKCITNKYNARTVNTQQLHKDVFLAKDESFYVTIGVNTLDMIYHLKTDKNNLIEISSKKC